jgi:protein TonB
MNNSDAPPARLRTAIALSIAVHICVLLLLVAVLGDRFVALTSEPDSGAATYITSIIHRVHPVAPVNRPPALVRRPVAVRPAPARLAPPVPQPLAAVVAAQGVQHATPVRHARPAERGTLRPRPSLALVPATAAPTTMPAPRPSPSPPSPTPPPAAPPARPATPAPTPVAAVAANFGGLFSQNYPPALAAAADLAQIRALLDRSARILVDVDETGRATDVHFLAPVSDPEIEGQIRAKLLALHYVPADCNGLHCDGTLEIRY